MKAIKFIGFNRVLINSKGEAESAPRALAQGIVPDIGFLRKDGWSLGSPKAIEQYAYLAWRDEWVGFILRGEVFWRPIEEYYLYGEDELEKHRAEGHSEK